jgi:hypothetical protein
MHQHPLCNSPDTIASEPFDATKASPVQRKMSSKCKMMLTAFPDSHTIFDAIPTPDIDKLQAFAAW